MGLDARPALPDLIVTVGTADKDIVHFHAT